MRSMLVIVALVAANLALAGAQSSEKPPVDIGYSTKVKLLTPRESIRAEDKPEPSGSSLTPLQRAEPARETIYNNMISVNLQVIINQNGRVESAHPVSGPKDFYAQAEAIEMRRAFEPIRIDGTIVRARFYDTVSVLPPERWADHPTPFPADPDLSTFSVTLGRTGCFGSCPSYLVTLNGAGQITFQSYQGIGVAVPGTHTAHISPEAVRDLLGRFRAANFFSALDTYQCAWTDLPTYTLLLNINGVRKRVVDYGGSVVGLPDAIKNLETAVDNATGTARWVRGNSETLASLQSEHWNFAASSSENLALYDALIQHGDRDLVHPFLIANAPIVSTDPRVLSPACVASAKGDRDLVQQMLAAQPRTIKLPSDLLNECLSMAAAGGNLAVVDLWLDRGARPVTFPYTGAAAPPPAHRFRPAVIGAIQSANPDVLARLLSLHPDLSPAVNEERSLITFALENVNTKDVEIHKRIVALIIEAGANINEAGKNDQTPPIFHIAFAPDLVSTLVAGGADVNTRGPNGETPLMNSCFIKEAIKSLLAAGADPMLKDSKGQTALDQAHNSSCSDCVAELAAAMKAHANAGAPTPPPVNP